MVGTDQLQNAFTQIHLDNEQTDYPLDLGITYHEPRDGVNRIIIDGTVNYRGARCLEHWATENGSFEVGGGTQRCGTHRAQAVGSGRQRGNGIEFLGKSPITQR